MLTSQKFTWSP